MSGSTAFPSCSFDFVSDELLRAILDSHYHQAKTAWEAGSWGGSIVLLGSVAEGILTWRLLQTDVEQTAYVHYKQSNSGKAKADLKIEQWNLSDLIDVAKKLKLLGQTAEQAACAVKDFRNLIHPYNLIRQGSARLDRALALTCLGGLLRIVDSVAGRLS